MWGNGRAVAKIPGVMNVRLGMWLIRVAAWTALGGLLASCGGGTSNTYTAGVHASVTTQANATGTLTVKYPTGFAVVKRGLSSKQRHAAYVNPSAGNVLNVYVDNQLVGGASIPVVQTTDSTQTVTVPFVSANSNVVTVYEYDSSANILAYGVSGSNAIAAGGTAAVTVTLAMNASRMGVTTDPVAGTDALLIDTTAGLPTPFCMAGSGQVYSFAADLSAGYVLPGVAVGSGGIPSQAIYSESTPGTSRFGAQQLGFHMTFDGGNDPLTASLIQTNPYNLIYVIGAVQFIQSADCTQAQVVYMNVSNYSAPNPYVPDNLPPASYTSFPVIAYQGFIYLPLSDINNDESFYLLKYDSLYNLISVTPLAGDRYISTITVNTVAASVTFEGQNSAGITLTYAQLSAL